MCDKIAASIDTLYINGVPVARSSIKSTQDHRILAGAEFECLYRGIESYYNSHTGRTVKQRNFNLYLYHPVH